MALQNLDSRPPVSNHVRPEHEPLNAPFTPQQFFWEAGIVIAACLGLALLAQVLVAAIGVN